MTPARQKRVIYNTSVYPLASVSTPEQKEGGTHSPTGEVVGEFQFGRLEKKLSTLPWVAISTMVPVTHLLSVLPQTLLINF